MRLTPQEIAAKATQRAQASTQDYVAGAMRVRQAPGIAAAANKATYVARVQEKADKWAQKVGAVSLTDWQSAVQAKSSRFSQGVAAAAPKTEAFWQKFGPVLDSNVAKVKSMPNASLEDRINRATTLMRLNAQYKG